MLEWNKNVMPFWNSSKTAVGMYVLKMYGDAYERLWGSNLKSICRVAERETRTPGGNTLGVGGATIKFFTMGFNEKVKAFFRSLPVYIRYTVGARISQKSVKSLFFLGLSTRAPMKIPE